jgi:hypothetical protein
MNGGTDPSQVAQNIIVYFGGPAGGYILAAALLIIAVLCFMHIASPRMFVFSLVFGVLAWTVSYIVRTTIGWA